MDQVWILLGQSSVGRFQSERYSFEALLGFQFEEHEQEKRKKNSEIKIKLNFKIFAKQKREHKRFTDVMPKRNQIFIIETCAVIYFYIFKFNHFRPIFFVCKYTFPYIIL